MALESMKLSNSLEALQLYSLFARAIKHTIGVIDWSPYLPALFDGYLQVGQHSLIFFFFESTTMFTNPTN